MAIRHILTKVGVEKTAIVFVLAVYLMFTAFGCRRSKMNPRAEKNGDVSPNAEENESNVRDEAEGKSARNENNEKKGNRMLSEKDREELLRIAREAVEAAVAGKQVPKEKIENENLQGKQGAFVTLKTNGNLRGCIGRFTADQPLWKTVREMAVSAATQDPRFRGHRIQPDECENLDIEISVLSTLKKTEQPLKDMQLGKHGIYIRRGMRTGCFLPQVAEETGWNKEQFLGSCCSHKAGLPANAWQDKKTEVMLFTAEVFSEEEPGEESTDEE